MEKYLAWDYSGPAFSLFGPAHVGTILALAVIGWWGIEMARKADPPTRDRLLRTLAVVLLINELGWHAFNLAHGRWEIDRMLPLQLCSIMIWLTIPALYSGSRRFDGLIYFLGIAGAVQALITPDAGIYGFPHFRFFQTMIAHGGLVIAGIWVARVEGYRPTRRSIWVIFAGLNGYAVLVFLVNRGIGSNYLYVNGKPDIPTLLDFLPDWPWYIGVLEFLALGLLLLLYLPFRRSAHPAESTVDL